MGVSTTLCTPQELTGLQAMFTKVFAAVITSVVLVTTADAAVLNGSFDVSVVTVAGLDSAKTQATFANYFDAVHLGNPSSFFTYDGAIDFGTANATSPTTITSWLDSGGGTVSDLGRNVAKRQQNGVDDAGSVITTFYAFTYFGDAGPGTFNVTHDGAIALFEDRGRGADRFAGSAGPSGVRTESFDGFGGSGLGFIYATTNGEASVLKIEHIPFSAQIPATVPLPAALPMLLAGLCGLGFACRRRTIGT